MSSTDASPSEGQISPESAGMSAARLERITRHLEDRYLQPGKIAGCQVLVHRRGHTAYRRCLGLMDRERGKQMRDDTIFRIYSMTKPITSVALMMLFEEGHFQLKDPVHRFIPEFEKLEVYESGDASESFRTRPCDQPMTVRDALMHMSGLASNFPGHPVDRAFMSQLPWATSGGDLESLTQTLARLPLKFAPGTRWNYGISTDICARLVEILSARRFDQFLHERIFQPLGMRDTGFFVPEESRARLAANYGRRRDKSLRLVDDPEQSSYLRPPSYLSGAGGLVSTMDDYLQFCRMLLAGGKLDGTRILSRSTLDLMTRNHLPGGSDLASVALGGFGETAFDGIGFGLGFATSLGATVAASVGGDCDYYWGGAASTIFWNDPSEDLAVIFLTQLMPSGTFNFRGQLRNLVYGSIDD